MILFDNKYILFMNRAKWVRTLTGFTDEVQEDWNGLEMTFLKINAKWQHILTEDKEIMLKWKENFPVAKREAVKDGDEDNKKKTIANDDNDEVTVEEITDIVKMLMH